MVIIKGVSITGVDVLQKQLAEVEVSPALQRAISEAVRQAAGVMAGEVAKASALGVALDHLKRAHDRHISEYQRRIVTDADLASVSRPTLSPN